MRHLTQITIVRNDLAASLKNQLFEHITVETKSRVVRLNLDKCEETTVKDHAFSAHNVISPSVQEWLSC